MKTTTTLVYVRDDKDTDDVPAIPSDGHHWYELKGKSVAEVEAVLLKAGFKHHNAPRAVRVTR